eukprot:CAMPEP_0119350632 /NCGR_PEP_ID=MMETSP1333-20130426/110157_1 /TAXON_ID=418940 /ORGANISM="Scyphosphaera apsteinii, Strain RCC1455" /LENGTH=52 /DNA_ID=CAMNT_0007363249 /DNA_START=949 /DNA_END=1107 /DNA_ORIENTATION=-
MRACRPTLQTGHGEHAKANEGEWTKMELLNVFSTARESTASQEAFEHATIRC